MLDNEFDILFGIIEDEFNNLNKEINELRTLILSMYHMLNNKNELK